MFYLMLKAFLSGLIVMAVSEIARRSPSLGGLVASLPLISVLGIIWLWRETGDVERVTSHAYATFWFVLPTLPMFLVFPLLMKQGIPFWGALALSCLLTIGLYAATMWLLPKCGIRI